MRGAPGALVTTMRIGGIIPADAGSTIDPDDPQPNGEDHPRGCGEHKLLLWAYNYAGSSPRMQGAL